MRSDVIRSGWRGGRRSVLAALAWLALGAPAALAHHGWSGYGEEPFTLTGVVEVVDLGQPHGHLLVRASDGGLWEVVLAPPSRTRRAGVTEGVIPIGATITAYGKRHVDPDRLEVKTERLQMGDQIFDIYPDRL